VGGTVNLFPPDIGRTPAFSETGLAAPFSVLLDFSFDEGRGFSFDEGRGFSFDEGRGFSFDEGRGLSFDVGRGLSLGIDAIEL
jgi:hypothetical protein